MGMRGLAAAFEPRTIALVGATDRPGSLGSVLLENLTDGFSGAIDLVNPTGRVIAGRRTVTSPADLPERPDLGVIATPPAGVFDAVTGLRSRGCRAAVIITDVLRGDGPDVDALRAAAGPMRLIGPNSLGIAAPWEGLQASMARIRPTQGGLAFVGQSATAAGPIVDWASERGIGFSHIMSLGEMADVDYADALDFFATSRRATAVVIYLEKIGDARRFLSAARALARIKPVIVMRGAEVSDTPARDSVIDAAFERAGMLRVRTLDDLFDASEAFLARLPADARPTALGDRLAILANGAAMGALAAQSARGAGVRLADLAPDTETALSECVPGRRSGANPVDLLPDADPDRYRGALSTLLDDPNTDAVLVLNGPTGVADGAQTATAIADVVAERRAKPGARKPWVFASWPGGAHERDSADVFDAAHIPHFRSPSDAVRAYGHLVRHRRTAVALTETPESRSEAFDFDRDAARALVADALKAEQTVLTDADFARLLGAYNIAANPDEELNHGAVLIRINAQVDPVFGPVLRIKLADHAGRRIDAGVAALPPLNSALARQTVARGYVGRLLSETDGGREAAALTLLQVNQLVCDIPELVGLELDPIVVRDGGAVTAGGRARIAPSRSARPADRLAIRPYPRELERRIIDRKGDAYLARPIRPEDEPALVRLIERLDAEHLRLRFFQPIKHVSHEFAARLTQIDYDREMAFVLTTPDALPGEADLFGVARLIRERDGESGEYAVTVDSERQGRGLGRIQMELLIDYARSIGMREVFGLVLAENRSMLALNRKLGFRTAMDPDDPAIVRVTLDLNGCRAETEPA